ncbi:MAG: acetyl-CoA carboxylase biotin carboxyl carrier protein [Deltaproteobacteria bacterium]|nr:acetyl-CoA carboxylase biotin carboxyl carrier protein [Deltaproteobacteria bacterium]
MGNFKLVLKKHGGSEINQRPSQSGEIVTHPEVDQERQSAPMDVKQRKPGKLASVPEKDRHEIEVIEGNQEEGYIPIRSPMLGTFYRAPKPGAPPFVEVGRWVSADDSVCIIEVMKLFNTVKANVRGRIAKICAENGQMVEYQQTLFLVEEVDEAVETAEEEIAT